MGGKIVVSLAAFAGEHSGVLTCGRPVAGPGGLCGLNIHHQSRPDLSRFRLVPWVPARRCSGGVRLHRGDEHRRWRCWRRWGAISRRGVQLAAPPAAVRGCRHAPIPQGGGRGAVGAGGWHRRANYCCWSVARVAHGHGAAAGGGGARLRGVGAAGRAGDGG